MDNFHAMDPTLITPILQNRIDYLQEQLKHLQLDEIEGYLIRSRLPKFEDKEPKIEYYSKLEKRQAKANMISILHDNHGAECTDQADLLRLTHDFYSDLYRPTYTDSHIQYTLLQKINTHLSPTQTHDLDSPITLQELTKAVQQLPRDKTPGRDGLPIEFYDTFWDSISHHYLDYINEAYLHGFKDSRNKGLIKILYKDKGDPKDLQNYRPISLLNCDLKILTKTLANRLKTVLPTIIHKTQTAVDGRKIDYTIHMLRDLIQLAENENLAAGFVFLDQEKAFDRVDHDFLFAVMKKFKFGNIFIKWLKQLYKNATTTILINGYETGTIPLLRGVRQGCPISSLLYVLVIEILGLQLRQNENLVGFQIGGEKIISLHYADDAVIVMKQNRCFKEVFKELADYEKATGAKVNMSKTQGLWVGAWKHCTDTPLGIHWTNTNVENLGIFFGNDNPALSTFQKIVNKIETSISFWKQFHLSKLAKSRIIEIFFASKLWYASRFYPIPSSITVHVQKLFTDFINWPYKRVTVARSELFKLRLDGGLKLIHVESKSLASKIMWLKDLLSNPTLDIHLEIVYRLLGVQPGYKQGLELFFVPHGYAQKHFKFKTPFYKESILAFTSFDVQQHLPALDVLQQQNIYYNRIFLDQHSEPLSVTIPRFVRNKIVSYQAYSTEFFNNGIGIPSNGEMTNIFNHISTISYNNLAHSITTQTQGILSLQKLTEKITYYELLTTHYRDHHSLEKWFHVFPQLLAQDWQDIWKNCHNILATEDTKTLIWEEMHLNFFTQYVYNFTNNLSDDCPLCHQPPENRMHLILTCPFTIQLWQDILPYLNLLHNAHVTSFEMAFGIIGTTPNIILRNWLTFKLRQSISKQEYLASIQPKNNQVLQAKTRMNQQVRNEVIQKYYYCQKNSLEEFFTKHFQFTDSLVRITPSQIEVANVFTL